jgi:hypothetical protein
LDGFERGDQERRHWRQASLGDFGGAIVCRAAVVIIIEMAPLGQTPVGQERSSVGTKTITIYVSDLDQSEIPAGQAYQLLIRHPDGSTQQLDISEQNYRDLGVAECR